jgi:hypothetical protein
VAVQKNLLFPRAERSKASLTSVEAISYRETPRLELGATTGGLFKNIFRNSPYLMLKELKERLNSRRLRGFNEIEPRSNHALPEKIFTQ